MKKYDVLVIGGGPAGLSAGYTLNKSGVRAAFMIRTAMPAVFAGALK